MAIESLPSQAQEVSAFRAREESMARRDWADLVYQERRKCKRRFIIAVGTSVLGGAALSPAFPVTAAIAIAALGLLLYTVTYV